MIREIGEFIKTSGPPIERRLAAGIRLAARPFEIDTVEALGYAHVPRGDIKAPRQTALTETAFADYTRELSSEDLIIDPSVKDTSGIYGRVFSYGKRVVIPFRAKGEGVQSYLARTHGQGG